MIATASAMNALVMTERKPGLRTCLLAGRRHGSQSLLTGITELDPLCETPIHWHNCEEFCFILEGEALVDLGEENYGLAATEFLLIPTSKPHRIVNMSAKERLRILWIYPSLQATRSLAAGGDPVLMDDSCS